MTWDSAFSIDDLNDAYERVKPIIEFRKKYKSMVYEYLKFRRKCPLIVRMHGSMYGAFGVSEPVPKITCLELPIPMKVRIPGLYLGNILKTDQFYFPFT